VHGGEPGADRASLGSRRRQRGAGVEAAEHAQPPHFAVVQNRGAGRKSRVHRHRRPEIEGESGNRPGEILRRYADDRELPAVDPQRAAEDRPIGAEATLPQCVADDGDRRPFRSRILLRKESAPDERVHAEHVEIIRRREDAPRPVQPLAPRLPRSGAG
jgi:hypothetical protein